jgi:hypothetical protein
VEPDFLGGSDLGFLGLGGPFVLRDKKRAVRARGLGGADLVKEMKAGR